MDGVGGVSGTGFISTRSTRLFAGASIIPLFGIPFANRCPRCTCSLHLERPCFSAGEIMRLSRDSACHCSRSVCSDLTSNSPRPRENNSASRVGALRLFANPSRSSRRKINHLRRETRVVTMVKTSVLEDSFSNILKIRWRRKNRGRGRKRETYLQVELVRSHPWR